MKPGDSVPVAVNLIEIILRPSNDHSKLPALVT